MVPTSIAYGEAVFLGIWYTTILTMAIAVWIMAIQLSRIAVSIERTSDGLQLCNRAGSSRSRQCLHSTRVP